MDNKAKEPPEPSGVEISAELSEKERSQWKRIPTNEREEATQTLGTSLG